MPPNKSVERTLDRSLPFAAALVARRQAPLTVALGAMSAYRDALSIGLDASRDRVELAAEILAAGTGVVLLENHVALRPSRTALICEVIDPAPLEHRCAMEYEVLLENARRTLEASPLWRRLPQMPQEWMVVEDYGSGTIERWRANS